MEKARNETRQRILVVDDAPVTLELIRRQLQAAGYQVLTASGVDEAMDLLQQEKVDLVITDMKMPKISGIDLVRHLHQNHSDIGVMMITGYATIEGAVEALKGGAAEYLAKPFTEEELLGTVEQVLENLQKRRIAHQESANSESIPGIVGSSRKMKQVYQVVQKAAGTSATALITGESGTGKELVARAIHFTGEKPSAPFIPVNISGIPESLIESALFGHVKGAFTGATENRQGYFQTAHGGTLFLDEVSEIPRAIQVKLLRVLQEREIVRVGETKPRRVKVRVLAATNRNLASLVKAGEFREDLFFRLNVVPITLPPLRERKEDIPVLVNHFAQRFSQEAGREMPVFTDEVMEQLEQHDWPGNVRELENVIQHLIVMVEKSRIEASDLPSLLRFKLDGATEDLRTLEEVEVAHIRRVLENAGGNKSQAARLLGIDRKTLREKLRKHGVEG